MTLTNYWWLLIWLALAGGLLAVAVPKKPVQVLGKTEYRWSWGAALVLACPYVIWAANRINFGDTEVYRRTFRDIPTLGGATDLISVRTRKRSGIHGSCFSDQNPNWQQR